MIRIILLGCLVAGCTSPASTAPASTTPASTMTARTAAASTPVRTLGQSRRTHLSQPALVLCRAALPDRVLLGWTAATVGELRAYGYSGPVAHVPLRAAFPGVATRAPAAWCWLRAGQKSGSLWGAVPGHGAVRAITVTGPGAARFVGEMHGPPRVP